MVVQKMSRNGCGLCNNGVDEIREISVINLPMPLPCLRYKVYIIDEVHMLMSTGAFNALLKTLEEPT